MPLNNSIPGSGMNKIDLLIGFVIGIISALLGSYLFILFFTNFDFVSGMHAIKSDNKLGKMIALGSVLDLAAFAILLQLNKELMARGVILAVISIAFLSLLI
jgi:hypothetical protein